MLLQISIKNYILIEKTSINFEKGLNIITGETGAGKSIFLSALAGVLGQKVSTDQISPGKDKLVVKAIFDIQGDLETKTKLDELGIDYEEDTLTIMREIPREGKSRCHANGEMIRIAALKELGLSLIDIHGQHENQYLFSSRNHRKIFDSFSGSEDLLNTYRDNYSNLVELKNNWDQLLEDEKQIKTEREFLEFQKKELSGKLLKEEEYDQLKEKLSHLEKNQKQINEIQNITGVLFNELLPSLEKLEPLVQQSFKKGDPEQNSFSEGKEQLLEFKNLVTRKDSGDLPQSEIDTLNKKLADAQRLIKKYGKSLSELSALLKSCQDKLDFVEDLDHQKDQLKKKILDAGSKAFELATKLHELRISKVEDFSQQINSDLAYMGMADSSVSVGIHIREKETATFKYENTPVGLDDNGFDKIEFLYKPAPQSEPKKLREIASGGEISRLMLSLKNTLYKDISVQTMVFDEIDTGIGGATALKVGEKMKELCHNRQIIAITHLPQIAKFAGNHLKVVKENLDGILKTAILNLSKEQRINEMARMISGDKLSAKDIQYAKEYIS